MTVWKNDVDAFFDENGKCHPKLSRILENLRASGDLSKKDKKARADAMFFKALPKKDAIIGSKLFALTILFNGNLPKERDIFLLRQQVDEKNLAILDSILAQF